MCATDDQGLHDSGPAGVAMAGTKDDDSSSEDDYDDPTVGDKEQASPERLAVLERARLLVRKAAILDKERAQSRQNEQERVNRKPLLEDAAPVASTRSRATKQKGAKGVPLQTGSVKAESNFSRYRRQSVNVVLGDKKRDDVVAAEAAVKRAEEKEKEKKVWTVPVSTTCTFCQSCGFRSSNTLMLFCVLS